MTLRTCSAAPWENQISQKERAKKEKENFDEAAVLMMSVSDNIYVSLRPHFNLFFSVVTVFVGSKSLIFLAIC